VNGYDIVIAMQKWGLERDYFLHQSDGNNFGPIACMKIMEPFHAIDVEEAREVYEKKNICRFIMAEWDRLVERCSNDLPVTVSEKLIDGTFELFFCCVDSPSMEVINLEELIRLPSPHQINFSVCLSVCPFVCLSVCLFVWNMKTRRF
jgi:hypothetical protein